MKPRVCLVPFVNLLFPVFYCVQELYGLRLFFFFLLFVVAFTCKEVMTNHLLYT